MALNFELDDLIAAFNQIKDTLQDVGNSDAKTGVMFANLYAQALKYQQVLEKIEGKQVQLEDLVQILGKNNLQIQKTTNYLNKYADQLEKVSLAERLQKNPNDHLGNIQTLEKEIALKDDYIEKLKLQKQLNNEVNKLNAKQGNVDSVIAAQAAEINRLNLLKNKGNLDKQIELVREEAQTYKEGTREKVSTESKLQMLLNRKAELEQKILAAEIQIKEAQIGNDPAKRLEYYNEILKKTEEGSIAWYLILVKIAKSQAKLNRQEQIKQYNQEKQAIENNINSIKKELDLRNKVTEAQQKTQQSALSLAQNIPGFQNIEATYNKIYKIFQDISTLVNQKQYISKLQSQMTMAQKQTDELNKRLQEQYKKLSDLKNAKLNTNTSNTNVQNNQENNQNVNVQENAQDTVNTLEQVQQSAQQTSGAVQQVQGELGQLQQKFAIITGIIAAQVSALMLFKKAADETTEAAEKLMKAQVEQIKKIAEVAGVLSGVTPILNQFTKIWKSFVSQIQMKLNYYQLKQFFSEGLSLAGEAQKQIAVVNSKFGEYQDEILKYAQSASQALGVSQQDVLKQANRYGGILKGWGLQAQESANLFIGVSNAAAASMLRTGKQYEYMMDKFNSYTAGPRAVSTELNELGLGYAATTDDLRTFSKELGYNFDNMNDTQRKYVELVYIAEKSEPIVNNLTKYYDTFSFRLKMLEQQIDNLKQAFGGLAQSLAYTLMPAIINVINFLQQLVNYINSILKKIFKIPDLEIDGQDAQQTMEDVQDQLDEIQNKLGQLDEVDVLSDQAQKNSEEGLFGGLYTDDNTSNIQNQQNAMLQIPEELKKRWGDVTRSIGDHLKNIIETTTAYLEQRAPQIREMFMSFGDVGLEAMNIVTGGFDMFLEHATQDGGVFDQIIANATGAANGLTKILQDNETKLQETIAYALDIVANQVNIVAEQFNKLFNDPDGVASVERFIDTLHTLTEDIDKQLEKNKGLIQDILKNGYKLILDTLSQIGTQIHNIFFTEDEQGYQLVDKILGTVNEILKQLDEFINSEDGAKFIRGLIILLAAKLGTMVAKGWVMFQVTKFVANAAADVYDFFKWIQDTIQNAIRAAGDLGNTLINKFRELENMPIIGDLIKLFLGDKSNLEIAIDAKDIAKEAAKYAISPGQWYASNAVKFYPKKKFASGGIVSGRVNALVGEYSNAQTNPEVISPLNKLRSMIGQEDNTRLIQTIVNKIDDIDQKLNNIQNKSNDIYLDGQVISRNVVNNINKTTITNGRSPLMA